MSMPEFPKPNPDITQEQALTMILSSIALEEVALSHIINAEGEKIQYVLNQTNLDGQPANLQEILEVNRSVTNLLDMVLQNQIILRNKMVNVLEYLPKPIDPPKPPDPPAPPCSPTPPCCMPSPCCCGTMFRFFAEPGAYCFREQIRWENAEGACKIGFGGCSRISLPCCGFFELELYMEGNCFTCLPGEVNITINCRNKRNVVKKICMIHHEGTSSIHQRIVLEVPEECSCYLTVLVCSQWGIDLREGSLLFTKL